VSRLSRRRLLQGLGGGLALPMLAPWRPRVARAGTGAAPKRLIVFHVPQGTVMRDFVPTGSETDFTLPTILEPLVPWQDRLCVVTGVDNLMPAYNTVGNAHYNANLTFMTGTPFAVQDETALSPAGPSIEQVIAERISSGTPFQRLDFAIGGSESSDGLYTPSEASYFWHGANDPVTYFNDPLAALLRVFGDSTLTPEEAAAQAARRGTVLGATLETFGGVRSGVDAADRARLDAHEDKLLQLESRVLAGAGSCTAPELATPTEYSYGADDDVTAPLMNELVTTALACDYTRVATLHFANSDSPEFPWLFERNGGEPIVDTSAYDNWHAMVHADYVAPMELAYRWYHEMLADLLTRLEQTTDADGDNLLDTTLILCVSEYSSGRHWNNALPVVLVGDLGPIVPGRWLDHLPGTVDDHEAGGGYSLSGTSMNQLHLSLLHAFGGSDEAFGFHDDSLPEGPLPGLM